MSYRISQKGKVVESPLPSINEKTLKKMQKEDSKTKNPLLAGIKTKEVSIRAI